MGVSFAWLGPKGWGHGRTGGGPTRTGKGSVFGDPGHGVRVGAGAALLALVQGGDLRHRDSSSSKSKISEFSSIRAGVVDFGKMMSPRWMCQRSTTWAGVLPTWWAMSMRSGRQHLALGDRGPGLGRDVVFGAVGADLLVGEVGVDLDLVHRRADLGLGAQPAQVVGREVRDADGAGPARAVELLERLPGLRRSRRRTGSAAASGSGTGRRSRCPGRRACRRRPCGRRRAGGSRCSACWSGRTRNGRGRSPHRLADPCSFPYISAVSMCR